MKGAILVTTSSFGVTDSSPVERMRAAGYEVRLNSFGRKLTRAESLQLLADEQVVGLLAGLEQLDAEVLAASHLRAIVRVGSGVSNVDLAAATARGIEVHRTPDGPTSAVAELTVGALLSLWREIPAFNADLHGRSWKKRTGRQIQGSTVLVVGYGRIGARVAELMSVFGAEVLVADPFVEEAVPFPVVTTAAGFPRADVICFHNSGAECLLDVADLERLKPGVVVLNASRGGVASEEALVEGLRRAIIGGVWLDVFSREPYDGPLCDEPRALLTPHVGSYTKECRIRMESDAVEILLDALSRAG